MPKATKRFEVRTVAARTDLATVWDTVTDLPKYHDVSPETAQEIADGLNRQLAAVEQTEREHRSRLGRHVATGAESWKWE